MVTVFINNYRNTRGLGFELWHSPLKWL